MQQWLDIAIQAGGAICVTGMFLWFLLKKQRADDESRREFLDHLDKGEQVTLAYLRERDAQAAQLARETSLALKELAAEFRELRGKIRDEHKQTRARTPRKEP